VYVSCQQHREETVGTLLGLVQQQLDDAGRKRLKEAGGGRVDEGARFSNSLRALPEGWRGLVIIDDLEEVQDRRNGQVTDARMGEFLHAVVEHGRKLCVLIVSEGKLTLDERIGRPGGGRVDVSLVHGLSEDAAVTLLLSKDVLPDQPLGLRDLPREILVKLATALDCSPGAITELANMLRADPTLLTAELLADDQRLQDFADAPARARYASLPLEERLVLRALSVYRQPVESHAVRDMLGSLVGPHVFERLSNYHAVIWDKTGYRLRARDERIAYADIPSRGVFRKAMLHAAAAAYHLAIARAIAAKAGPAGSNTRPEDWDLAHQRDWATHIGAALEQYERAEAWKEMLALHEDAYAYYLMVYHRDRLDVCEAIWTRMLRAAAESATNTFAYSGCRIRPCIGIVATRTRRPGTSARRGRPALTPTGSRCWSPTLSTVKVDCARSRGVLVRRPICSSSVQRSGSRSMIGTRRSRRVARRPRCLRAWGRSTTH